MRSGKRWITAGLCCLILLIGSHPPILAEDRAKSFAQDLAAAKRAGIPTTPQELQAPLPPPNQNAAPLYLEIDKILKEHPLDKDDKILASGAYRAMPSAEQFERMRRALKHRSELVALARKATLRPQYGVLRDWTNPFQVLSREVGGIRYGARFLATESLLMAHDGKPLEAVRSQALGFTLATHATEEQFLLGYLTSHTVNGITLSGLQKILYVSGSDVKVAESVQSVVEKAYVEPILRKALQHEAGVDIAILRYLRKNGAAAFKDLSALDLSQALSFMPPQKMNAFLDDNGSILLKYVQRLMTVADSPYPKADSVFRAVQAEYEKDKDPMHTLTLILFQAYPQNDERQARLQAMVEVTRAGAFALSWKARHGAFPEKLDGASSPKFVDPFDGKPLRYRREGAGFVVYSVGATGKFTGGTPDQKAGNETRFRYPAPSEFTLPLREK